MDAALPRRCGQWDVRAARARRVFLSNGSLDAIWRIESPKLIAALTRVVRDVGLAEELAQDAFVAALTQWPGEGVPRNPGAWLTAVAKRRAIDRFRRDGILAEKSALLTRDAEPAVTSEPDFDALDGNAIPDDLLRLIFIACHPVLAREARAALTLRLLGGLTTGEIARAFLVAEATVAQRIVRAKRALAEARVPFEVPDRAERGARVGSVLEVIYLIYNEGYAATAGDDVLRPALCEEALRLGRILAELTPDEPEVHGLVGLMELQHSRAKARVDACGEPVLLLEQDRAKWDYVLIGRGLAAIERAEALGGTPGPYALQAVIAACYARSRSAETIDWQRIAALYDVLAEVLPTSVVRLNRAVAIGMAYGPAAGLELVEALADEPALQSYHLLPSVHGNLLEKLARFAEAGDAYERAAGLAQNERDKALLRERAHRARMR